MRLPRPAQDVLASIFFVAFFACSSPLTPRLQAGEEWARKMFTTTQHDFGTVPRGAKSEFEFKLKNAFKEDIHIASARSSCACTQPKILKADLKTYEESAIIAELNTQSFVGQRSAVVTVVFDRPYYAEVQLLVKGNIRSDISIEPGEVQFGDVDVGQIKSADVKVAYQGTANRDWQITDVRSTNQHLSVKLNSHRENGRTVYLMNVRLKETAPSGELNDEIQIVTNDKQYKEVTLPVRASVIPPLSVAPLSIELGSMRAGSAANSRLILKSKTPFGIKSVDCQDDRFTFKIPEGQNLVRIVPVEFRAGETLGAFKRTIQVTSTLPDEAKVEVTVTGNIIQ